MQKIIFFSEAGFYGKTSIHDNMRTEYCWYNALNADHCNIFNFKNFLLNVTESEGNYDLGILIIPKNIPKEINVSDYKPYCNKIAFMQEGPNYYFQDYDLKNQIQYYNILMDVDFILCHNEYDIPYYAGLTNKKCFVLPSLMLPQDNLKLSSKEEKVMIGGNFTSWYGGFISFLTSGITGLPISAPSMGRMAANETLIDGYEQISHLPYMNWNQWIETLSSFKYAVHLMPTIAAGTFSLNCAYLGIPCIGNKHLDTQRLCFPELSIDVHNVVKAKELLTKLIDDKNFYNECSNEAVKRYKEYFDIEVFKNKFKYIFEGL